MTKKARVYQWRDPSRRAKVANGVLAVGIIVMLATATNKVLFGAAADYTEILETGPQLLAWALDLLTLLVVLACVTVLLWIWRVNANAHVFKPKMRFSPLGAIGFYLVPFVSLFLPFAASCHSRRWRRSGWSARAAATRPLPSCDGGGASCF